MHPSHCYFFISLFKKIIVVTKEAPLKPFRRQSILILLSSSFEEMLKKVNENVQFHGKQCAVAFSSSSSNGAKKAITIIKYPDTWVLISLLWSVAHQNYFPEENLFKV